MFAILCLCLCINAVVFFPSTQHAMPNVVRTSLPGSRMDAKICQRNPDVISFIYAEDIWVANIRTGQELRLTFVRTPGRDEYVSAGIPSFVTQEEFDRFTGYWWEPKGKKNLDDTGKYLEIVGTLIW